jgi:hypothetical protein
MFEVKSDALFVAGVQGPPGRRAIHLLAPLPNRIAGRRLDLDHFGAEIGQQSGAEWRSDEMSNFKDT